MAKKYGKTGYAKDPRFSLELISTYDNQEDITTAGARIDLTTGIIGIGAGTRVGDRIHNRVEYYARGFHNWGSTAVTIKYNLIRDGATDTAREFSARIPAGATVHIYDNVGQLTANTTNPSSLKVFYKEREIIDATQPGT